LRKRAYFVIYGEDLGVRKIKGLISHAKARYFCYLCDKPIEKGEAYIYRKRLFGRGALCFCLDHVLGVRPVKSNRWLSKRVYYLEGWVRL
jgi:hypothetical protein